MELKHKSSCPEENLVLLSLKGCLISPQILTFVVSYELEISKFATVNPSFTFFSFLSIRKITSGCYNPQNWYLDPIYPSNIILRVISHCYFCNNVSIGKCYKQDLKDYAQKYYPCALEKQNHCQFKLGKIMRNKK